MNQALMSTCRDTEHRSNKSCCCGGHNANNYKSNLNHNGTKIKNHIRLLRKMNRTDGDFVLWGGATNPIDLADKPLDEILEETEG